MTREELELEISELEAEAEEAGYEVDYWRGQERELLRRAENLRSQLEIYE